MKNKPEVLDGSGLAESVTCKICGNVLILPKQPPTIGLSPEAQRFKDYAEAFYKGVMVHMAKKHKAIQSPVAAWSEMFSEGLIMSLFNLELSPLLMKHYNVKRLQILSILQRKVDPGMDPEAQHICALFEETVLRAELAEDGFKLATSVLPESSPIIKA
jgi:hypothetical protein